MKSKYLLVCASHLLITALLTQAILLIFPFITSWMCSSFSCLLWIFIATLAFNFTKEKFLNDEIDGHNRAVFITGCDTGFGNALAKRLDSKGFHVFASCLFPTGTGAVELKARCSERLHVLHADVTKDESVAKAVEYVRENLGSSALWAIVNNAGIVKGFSVELSFVNDFKDCLDVNLLGYVRVTKAFLPLLKQSKGRIVNITSAAGELPLPFFTPYTASKYATVGFTDCLRFELDTWGISVVSVEPEMFLTALTSPEVIQKNMNAKLNGLDSSFQETCCGDYADSFKDIADVFLSFLCPKTSIVVDDMVSAVSLVHPCHTFTPRRHALSRFICFCYEVMPRGCQILLVKLIFFVFFSESKTAKNIVVKLVSWL